MKDFFIGIGHSDKKRGVEKISRDPDHWEQTEEDKHIAYANTVVFWPDQMISELSRLLAYAESLWDQWMKKNKLVIILSEKPVICLWRQKHWISF